MNKNSLALFLLILLACIWGSSFILMKLGMQTSDGTAIFNDRQVGALRILIAALFMLPFSIRAIKKLKLKRDILFLTIVGFCGNFIPAFLFTYAETELSSGYAGMLNSFTPAFTLLIGGLLFKQKLTAIQFLGVLIAFIGIVCLMLAGRSLNSAAPLSHTLAIVFATFCYGLSLNSIKHRLSHFNSIDITALSFGILLLPSILATLFTDSYSVITHNTYAWQGLGYIAILSIVGTAIALMVFNKVIALSSTLFASSVTYLIPIVAVIIGSSYGERINSLQVGSMFIVLIGVFVANYWKRIFKSKVVL